jgi:hypothetical protein
MATGGRTCQSIEEVSRVRRAPLDDPERASESSKWGHMAALRGTRIVSVPLEAAVGEIETAG